MCLQGRVCGYAFLEPFSRSFNAILEFNVMNKFHVFVYGKQSKCVQQTHFCPQTFSNLHN